jgi:glucose/arabinose dehydrogenase
VLVGALLVAGAGSAAQRSTLPSFRKTLAARGFAQPLQVTAPRSEPGRLYVVEQRGTVRVIDHGRTQPGFFLDVRSRVTAGGEQGLLGLAFDPRYASNRLIYVDYTDTSGDTRVVRFRTNGVRALPATASVLLAIDQPYPNHNGGNLVFGPDGYLYVGTGDGGAAGDPENRAQNTGSLLGKMLRLDVRRPGIAPEMVGLGLRNPWRYSFDRATGDLYIGDVGQDTVEEIDFTPRRSPGLENYGWSAFEGTRPFKNEQLGPGTLVSPIFQYTHARGCSVTGGFVYRGRARPALRGRYVFGDYCSGTVWSLRVVGGRATAVRVEPFTIPNLSSFGEDPAGELYAVSQSRGAVYRLT